MFVSCRASCRWDALCTRVRLCAIPERMQRASRVGGQRASKEVILGLERWCALAIYTSPRSFHRAHRCLVRCSLRSQTAGLCAPLTVDPFAHVHSPWHRDLPFISLPPELLPTTVAIVSLPPLPLTIVYVRRPPIPFPANASRLRTSSKMHRADDPPETQTTDDDQPPTTEVETTEAAEAG